MFGQLPPPLELLLDELLLDELLLDELLLDELLLDDELELLLEELELLLELDEDEELLEPPPSGGYAFATSVWNASENQRPACGASSIAPVALLPLSSLPP
jgi:hypothetical protein